MPAPCPRSPRSPSAYPGRLEVIEGDALEIDYAALADGPTRIVANLPYNIATPLLVGWLTTDPWPPFFESLTLMFQREVAERIVAKPGDEAVRPARRALRLADRCEDRVQCRPQRLHAAAEGHVVGRPPGAEAGRGPCPRGSSRT